MDDAGREQGKQFGPSHQTIQVQGLSLLLITLGGLLSENDENRF